MIAPWADRPAQTRLRELEARHQERGAAEVADSVHAALAAHHHRIDTQGLVLYAGTNVLSPAVRAAHDTALSTRPCMGWPGSKVQTGVQEIEDIEVIAITQVARSMRATHAETRFLTATMANLAVYSAFTEPGDTIAVLSPESGGHPSHHAHATAGIRGLTVEYLPYQPDALDVDTTLISDFLTAILPKLVLVGGSVTLFPHQLGPIREAADRVGALLIYDASHPAGLIAAGYVQAPLAEGAHIITFSTYKTYAGPAGGAAVTNDSDLAQRISHAAYPVMLSNYDPARLGPLAIAAAEAVDQTPAWAELTITAAQELAAQLSALGQVVIGRRRGYTTTHQVVVDVSRHGGGPAVTTRLAQDGIYVGACRLPWQQPHTPPEGLRLGTQEIVRLGANLHHIPHLAALLDQSIRSSQAPGDLTATSTEIRASFGSDIWHAPTTACGSTHAVAATVTD